MGEFIRGQRWISSAELQLGLGTILSTDARTVTVLFPACGETRTYARQSAPLTRIAFAANDTVRSLEGWSLTIQSVNVSDGLIRYRGIRDDGRSTELDESRLNHSIRLSRPADRLFSTQIDVDKWFELRLLSWQHLDRLLHCDLRGLSGGRTALIPHQLYIAHEVANRYAPRVLLADEVGLGKTIEAGLIIHHQLLSGYASRVLVVVPESLQHQWLVEMLRRFNLHFSLYDAERCRASGESIDNPFEAEQLVLCSLEFLRDDPQGFRQSLMADWDLLVVDEAHHLQWSPAQASPEYALIEALAQKTRGVLLLTATPEQLGKAGHFARLRLLDPDRFPSLDRFVEEEQHYQPYARIVEALLAEQPLEPAGYQILLNTIEEGDNRTFIEILQNRASTKAEQATARSRLVEHLLDRHGTGRVLFRNTRAAVQGFPDRTLISVPLPLPPGYRACLEPTARPSTPLGLYPERLYATTEASPAWVQIDPRIDWLVEQLRHLAPAKILLIAAHAATVIELAEALRTRTGIHAGLFHERLSLVERDRAAAYFANPENGTPILLCSEIGSEGRNFQFAHHLILFDLPLHPDLLEQRIGRLDRIGQTETIQIHAPYLENSPQEVLFHWYQEGLSAFEQPSPAAAAVFSQCQKELMEQVLAVERGPSLAAFIEQSRHSHQELSTALQRGRDRLLEYNSCRPEQARQLRDRVIAQDNPKELLDFLEQVCDCFGIDMEDHRPGSHLLKPGSHMQSQDFPGLPEEGMTITCDRTIALANEDMQFITWEYPLICDVLERVTGGELGNSALTIIKHADAKAGSLYLECLFVLETIADKTLQTDRYLPAASLRLVIDQDGNDRSYSLTHALISQPQAPVPADTAAKIIRAYREELKAMLTAAENRARQTLAARITAATERAQQTLGEDIQRLKALRRINPNVREAEIQRLEQHWQHLMEALSSADVRLDAVRVVIAT